VPPVEYPVGSPTKSVPIDASSATRVNASEAGSPSSENIPSEIPNCDGSVALD
jgi:hypothetical protein